jgi:hypothetical protein
MDDLKLQLWCIRNLPTNTPEQIKYYNTCLFKFPGKHDLKYKEVPKPKSQTYVIKIQRVN